MNTISSISKQIFCTNRQKEPFFQWNRHFSIYNSNLHFSKAELPAEIAQRVTGEPLNAKYFVDYLKDKYGTLYGLNTPAAATP